MATQDHAYVQDFAIQLFPIWIAVPILIAVVFGLWKLAKIIWAAISNGATATRHGAWRSATTWGFAKRTL